MTGHVSDPVAAGDGGDAVVLLDDAGTPIGTMAKDDVHGAHTPLHRGFSVYVFGSDSRLLVTRRSLAKRTWPGVWSNSCCGHPRPGEAAIDGARRRLLEELTLTPTELTLVLPDFAYSAVSPEGLVENEHCPVFTASVDADPICDPAEVAQWLWVPWASFAAVATSTPWLISPWAALQVPLLLRAQHSGLHAP